MSPGVRAIHAALLYLNNHVLNGSCDCPLNQNLRTTIIVNMVFNTVDQHAANIFPVTMGTDQINMGCGITGNDGLELIRTGDDAGL